MYPENQQIPLLDIRSPLDAASQMRHKERTVEKDMKERGLTLVMVPRTAAERDRKKWTIISRSPRAGGAVAQSVELATSGKEVPGSIPAVASRSLLVGSVSV